MLAEILREHTPNYIRREELHGAVQCVLRFCHVGVCRWPIGALPVSKKPPARVPAQVNEDAEVPPLVQLQQGFASLVLAVDEALQFSNERKSCASLLDYLCQAHCLL